MNTLRTIFHDQRGYSLVELLSILMIMGVLTLLVIFNTRTGDEHQQLRDAASDYTTAVKQAESMAAAAQPVLDASDNTLKSRKSYGVCITGEFASTPCTVSGAEKATRYQLFARRGNRCVADPTVTCLGWGKPDNNVDVIKTYTLPKSAVFVLDGASTYIDYMPPAPTMEVHRAPGPPVTSTNEIQIILSKDYGQPCSTAGVYCNTIAMRPGAGVVYVK